MIQIQLNGHTYKSISAAWRAESPKGLPMITVRWRLKNGWSLTSAFLSGPIAAKYRRFGHWDDMI